MTNLHERAATRIQATLDTLSVTDPWLYLLAMFCDVILDDSLGTAATNGTEILVNPYFACHASGDQRTAALSVAVVDAVMLHPITPPGLSMHDWSVWSFQALPDLPGKNSGAIRITDRLRPPPADVDLVAYWGRRLCWLRSFLLPGGEAPPGWVPWPSSNTSCIACQDGEHRPIVLPHFEVITRGHRDVPTHVPARAEDCFCAVWALTCPVLSLEDYRHGLEWLARCGASAWLHLAMWRLLPVLERQGRLQDWLECCRSSIPLRTVLLRLVGLHRPEGRLSWPPSPRWFGPIASREDVGRPDV